MLPLQRMLAFHPGKRITVEDALAHPYLASLHDPSDEPLAHAEFSFDFERMPLTKQVLRDLLSNEMLCFHPELRGDPAYAHVQAAQGQSVGAVPQQATPVMAQPAGGSEDPWPRAEAADAMME